VQVPARVDYAIRAMLELAAVEPQRLSRDDLAERQQLPTRYLEAILRDLARERLLVSRRGVAGGYELARPAAEITVADVSRAVDGPLALIAQQRPGTLDYEGSSEHLGEFWVGLRAAIRSVMEHVTLVDLLEGELPASVREMLDDAGAWHPRL
jgi:Rrf2 family protein